MKMPSTTDTTKDLHNHADTDFDIAICGAGPVGMTLAALLVRRGMTPQRIALIDAKTIAQAEQDPRSIALSYGSRQLLEDIGAWPLAATPIHQIHVSRRAHFGRTLIDRTSYDLPALGYVTRYGALVTALAKVIEQSGVASIRPTQLLATQEGAAAVDLQCTDGKKFTANILVQAEGGVFSEQSEKAQRREYAQTAIVAHVRVSAPNLQRAFERFTDEGPLALLPQEDGYALVWCVRHDTASTLRAMSDAEFLAALAHAFGTRLGRFTHVTPRNSYPLGLNAQPSATPRTVAIGNAAQTLHPVAGQGLNLGLRDASVLAQQLAQDASAEALQRYAQTRQSDRNLTIRLTDTMARIFASAPEGALSQTLLGLSLGLTDGCPPVKRLLAEQMMFGWR